MNKIFSNMFDDTIQDIQYDNDYEFYPDDQYCSPIIINCPANTTALTGPQGIPGPTGPTGATGSLPIPASANFASTITQTFTPSEYYTPVQLTIYTPNSIKLEDDGYTITIQKQGLYFITYSFSPTTEANEDTSVALLLPKNGNPPPVLLLSNRPLKDNNSVTSSFVASFANDDQLYLGVNSNKPITIAANSRRSANVTLSIVQIG